jgi:2-phosphosulfolactate phosphatase
MQLNVHLRPADVDCEALAGGATIVVDQLRATTTICYALAAGADCVMPFVDIAETLLAAEKFGRHGVLLGGERGGRRIEGFDLGNSPSEYATEVVGGRRILFTTTNGAKALLHAAPARQVLAGALVNRLAVARYVATCDCVDVLCAGTSGEPTGEDVLAAGAIVQALVDVRSTGGRVDLLASLRMNEQAFAAMCDWSRVAPKPGEPSTVVQSRLVETMRETTGGRNLLEIGLDADLADCARLDALDVVPVFDPASGEIRPA